MDRNTTPHGLDLVRKAISSPHAEAYLSADGRTGWRGLGFSAAVNGEELRPKVEGEPRDAGDGRIVLALTYPIAGLGEQVTLRLRDDPASLTVERALVNAGREAVEVQQVTIGLASPDSAVLFADAAAADLRCVHVSNLRETHFLKTRRIGPYVSPMPEQPRLIGDSESYPFPALAIARADLRDFLLEGAVQQDVFTQMWRIAAGSAAPGGSVLGEYAAIARDGRRQPITLAAGEQRRLAGIYYQIIAGRDLQDIYDDYLAELARRYELKGKTSPLLSEAIYCTWNYTFFADINEEIIARQAAFVSKRLKGVRHFLIDDGYQLSGNTPTYDMGKFYPDPDANIDPVRFPNGMAAAAETIRSCGLRPALWWTPAMGRRNRLVAERPEWLCLNDAGESWSMDSGPHRKAALDFSVKEAREFVEFMLETIFVKWGFEGMKLDFCTYPFDLKDIRLRHGEGVRWWYWFLEAIDRFIPPGGFFQLCGGAPYGSPLLGRFCDNHRVGGDIGKGPWAAHRAVSGAPLPLLGVAGRTSLLMDVDSAGVCPGNTDDEDLSRLTFCFITQGVMGIGGDLTALSGRQIEWLDRISKAPDRGHKVRCPDRGAFVGEPLPEALYVDYPPDSRTARAGVVKHLALFNWLDEPRTIDYPLTSLGVRPGDRIRDFWSGKEVVPAQGRLAVELAPHASGLLAVSRP